MSAHAGRLKRAAGFTGFTLLELLIAISLLGFILVLLFGGLRLGSRSWDAGELRSGQNTHLALLQGFLRRELGQVQPFRWKKKVDRDFAFDGEAGKLSFVAPIAVHLAPGGLHLVRLEVVRDRDGSGQLVMKYVFPEADDLDFGPLDSVEKMVLAEQVEAVEFAYFGAESKDAEPQWKDRWDNRKRMPYMIRMRVKFSNGRDWPDLVVPLLTGADAGCEWDNQTSRCVGGA